MKKIWVTFRKKAIHRYPLAQTDPNLQDVHYLGFPHRHLFYFKVSIEVFHDDRDIEFHQFLNWIESLYDSNVLQLDFMSCEMISDTLAVKIREKYPNRYLSIEVSEDGECGCQCDYDPLILIGTYGEWSYKQGANI